MLTTAPALPPPLQWMNCEPLALNQWRGHPVLLAFWNVSSGPSLNLMQWFVQVAHRARGKAGFLAIHVPRFDAERDGRQAWRWLESQGFGVPLANDPEWAAWQAFDVSAWPTLLLLDGDGRICRRVVGDRGLDALSDALDSLIDASFLRASGVVHNPILKSPSRVGRLVRGAALATTATRLFVADAGAHQVLECTYDGKVVRRIGNGSPDFIDAEARDAGLHSPAGLAVIQDKLYIADAGNHALRVMDARVGNVDTLVGGARAGEPRPGRIENAKDSLLDRPVGLAADGSRLLLGLWGCHQVWSFDVASRELRLVAGNGELGLTDGPVAQSRFAAPSGFAVSGDQIWVVDAGTSSLRLIHQGEGVVNTWFGRGPFDFGYRDGGRKQAMLQSPQGICLDVLLETLWVADTGNGCVRMLPTQAHQLSTAPFGFDWSLPVAVARGGGALWVLDAGLGALVRVDPQSGEASILDLQE